MLEQIMRLASAIAQPSEAEQPLLEALCTAAEEEMRRRLRAETTPEDCGDAFLCAAALLAAAAVAAIAGLAYALYERLREIDKGEADEAKKY